MANNFWNTGAVDNIYAPYQWSNGELQPGDNLIIGAGAAFVPGGSVDGDTVVLSSQSGDVPAVLVAFGDSSLSVLVAQQAYPAMTPGAGTSAYGTVEVVGAPLVSLAVQGGMESQSQGTVNIADYSQMRGGFTGIGPNAAVTINGGDTSTFANAASSLTGNYSVADINAVVVGDGTFDIGFLDAMTFNSSVSAGQTINDNGGLLTIADTPGFHASVDWSPMSDLGGNNDHIELSGVGADHYSYANGVLALTSGGSDVFDLHLRTNPSSDVVAAQGSGGIQVYASAATAAAANAVLLARA